VGGSTPKENKNIDENDILNVSIHIQLVDIIIHTISGQVTKINGSLFEVLIFFQSTLPYVIARVGHGSVNNINRTEPKC